MAKVNEYDTVLVALKSSNIHAVSRDLKAADIRTRDTELRMYLRSAIGLLNSPSLQGMNMRGQYWLPFSCPSIRPLVDYCLTRSASQVIR